MYVVVFSWENLLRKKSNTTGYCWQEYHVKTFTNAYIVPHNDIVPIDQTLNVWMIMYALNC